MTEERKNLLTDLSLIFIALVWALNFTVVKATLAEIDPYTFNALRFILASLFIWCVIAKRGAWFTIDKKDWFPLIFLGLVGNVLYQWLFIVGIDLTLAANAAVLLGTIPIWVGIISHFLSIELLNRLKTIGVFLGFAGVVFIIIYGKNPITFGSDTFVGDIAIVTAAVVWATFTIFSKQHLVRYTPLQFSAFMTTLGAITLTLIAIPYSKETAWESVSAAAYGGVVYSGLLSIGLAYLIWNNGLQRVGAVRTAAYQNLVPVLGLLFGIMLLGENLELLQYIGSAIVITGILITRHGGRVQKL
jgi:drug/metabolite transporter (DMT)-like permease